jgi:hypothetical protein
MSGPGMAWLGTVTVAQVKAALLASALAKGTPLEVGQVCRLTGWDEVADRWDTAPGAAGRGRRPTGAPRPRPLPLPPLRVGPADLTAARAMERAPAGALGPTGDWKRLLRAVRRQMMAPDGPGEWAALARWLPAVAPVVARRIAEAVVGAPPAGSLRTNGQVVEEPDADAAVPLWLAADWWRAARGPAEVAAARWGALCALLAAPELLDTSDAVA